MRSENTSTMHMAALVYILLLLGACSSLYLPVAGNDLQALEKAISEGADVNFQSSKNGIPPLTQAIYFKGNIEIVKSLLKAGADPNLSTHASAFPGSGIVTTPLILAAQKGYSEIADLLLKAGATPDLTDEKNQTPLAWAASRNHPNIISLLLKNGANPEIKDNKYSQTPLMIAVIKGHSQVIENLLSGGTSPNHQSKNGSSPLLQATLTENIAAVELLLKNGADPNLAKKDGFTPLMAAAHKNNSDLIKLLIENKAQLGARTSVGMDAVFWAVLNKSIDALKDLLTNGASPNTHSSRGSFPLIHAVSQNNIELTGLLIANGADINMKNNYGNTALIYASASGYIDIVKLLLKNGADPTAVQSNGVDALTAANSRNFYTIATLIKSALLSPTKTPESFRPSPTETPSPQYSFYTGTGWLTTGGYIVTNYHVIDGQIETRVRFNSVGQDYYYEANIILSDRHNDLAVLELKETPEINVRGIEISDKLPKVGEEVFTIGYPKTSIMGMNPKVTNGIVSSLSGLRDDPRIIQTTVAIQPGNSGGPLLNMHGEVVGVTTSMLRAIVTESGLDIPQSVNYAVKSAYILALLSSLPKKEKYHVITHTRSKLEDIVPKIQDSIVQVIVKAKQSITARR